MDLQVGGDIEKVDGKVVFDSMHAGDETAKKVVDTYLEYVACGLTNIINTFQPEILCIGGGISNQGEVILAPIREYVKKYRYSQDPVTLMEDRGVVTYLYDEYGYILAAKHEEYSYDAHQNAEFRSAFVADGVADVFQFQHGNQTSFVWRKSSP